MDRYWNEFSATPSGLSEAARDHYASLYALPGATHSGFMPFAAFDLDVSTIERFSPKGSLSCRSLRSAREIVRQDDGRDHGLCRHRALASLWV
jgi:hypothetical protein